MGMWVRSFPCAAALAGLVLLGVAPSIPRVAGAAPAESTTASDAQKDYDESVRKGDAFFAAGDYFEAVHALEHARRVAYNNKLTTDKAALEQKLARATAARDGSSQDRKAAREATAAADAKSFAATAAAQAAAAGPASSAAQQYDAAVREGDAYADVGNHFDAVLSYERARRVAYNNKLPTDTSALDQKLARARGARDGTLPAGQAVLAGGGAAAGAGPEFIELTTLLDSKPRVISGRDVPQGNEQHYGPFGRDSRWIVSNPYLPLDRRFLPYIYGMACATDGTLYLGGESVVPAAEAKRQPRSNRDWYADNGMGIWKVARDGKVTAFGVRPYGTQVGGTAETAKCDVEVRNAGINVQRLGGMAVDSHGDVVFSDRELNLILRMRRDGRVEHVAGGGAQACKYERYKTPQQSGDLDGPARQALFKEPRGLAFDQAGNLYVADAGNCAMRKIDTAGNVTTIGKKSCLYGNDAIVFDYVAVDRDGMPIVSGGALALRIENFAGVYRYHPDGTIEQLLAGRRFKPRTPGQYVGELTGMGLLPDGTLLISDGFEGENENRLLQVRNGSVSRFLGVRTDKSNFAEIDGPADKAQFFAPGQMCATGDGMLYILPRHSLRPLRKFDPATKSVSTWIY
jgi:hypothetical protein